MGTGASGKGAVSGRRAGLALALVGLLSAAGWVGTARAGCSTDEVELRGDWGSARFSIEIADDSAERAQGLMYREKMPRSAGMLFVFEQPGPVSFWMRNTLIPLDMIFADARGVVRRVHSRAIPGDETPIEGGTDIRFVLEINGGMAQAMGIAVGSELRHPAIGAAAVWPCE